MLTYKYNNQHTGSDTSEVALNTSNVNSRQFGKLMNYPVNGAIQAQPLYVPDVSIGGQTLNLVIVATDQDIVYAFDADRRSGDTTPVWQNKLTANFSKKSGAGIIATPLIDPGSNIMYVVDKVQNTYDLHALNIQTGQDKAGSPQLVQPSDPHFNGAIETQRSALLLVYNRIFVAFASSGDLHGFHGWIISYSYNGHAFIRQATINITPDGVEGGVWGAGGALAADTHGWLYASTGNGTFNLNTRGRNGGDSYLKYSTVLNLVDYFTPFNQSCISRTDLDLGSGGVLITPNNELISGGKDGKVYVVDTSHMGHFRVVNRPCQHQDATNLDVVKKELPLGTASGGIFSTPVYWAGPGGPFVYITGHNDITTRYHLVAGKLIYAGATTIKVATISPQQSEPRQSSYPYTPYFSAGYQTRGANPVVSSNGKQAGTGILWRIDTHGYLRAFNATNLSQALYEDQFGATVNFSTPIVSNGKVFVPGQTNLTIYGLLPK